MKQLRGVHRLCVCVCVCVCVCLHKPQLVVEQSFDVFFVDKAKPFLLVACRWLPDRRNGHATNQKACHRSGDYLKCREKKYI